MDDDFMKYIVIQVRVTSLIRESINLKVLDNHNLINTSIIIKKQLKIHYDYPLKKEIIKSGYLIDKGTVNKCIRQFICYSINNEYK